MDNGEEDDGRTPLSKAFGTEDSFPEREKREVSIFPPSNVKADDSDEYNTRYVDADYEYTRENVTKTIERSTEVIEDMMKFAKASQSARAYEVLATMFKVNLDANKDLLELAARNKVLKEHERENGDPSITNNTLVVSSDQLLNMLRNQGIETKTRKIKEE